MEKERRPLPRKSCEALWNPSKSLKEIREESLRQTGHETTREIDPARDIIAITTIILIVTCFFVNKHPNRCLHPTHT